MIYLNYIIASDLYLVYLGFDNFHNGINLLILYGLKNRIIVSESSPTDIPVPFEIVPYMLDANGHVNNCQYIKLARTQIREEFPYRRFGAEYVAQAHLGDVMIPRIAKLEDGWQIALLKPDGKPYLVTEWKE